MNLERKHSSTGPGVFAAVAFGCLLHCGGVLARNTVVDPTFDPGSGVAGGIVESVLPQDDGRILICGNFESFNGVSRGFVARLNVNGSVDTSFEAHPGYWVRHMALQPDGKIVIGGFFTQVEGLSRNRIARLNSDGSLDTSFDPGLGAQAKLVEGDDKDPFIFAVAVQPSGKILIAGNFRTYNGVLRNGIARLNSDGSLDTGFEVGSGFDSWGRSLLLLPNDQVIVTGWFTRYNNAAYNRMVRLNPNGTADESFRPSFGDKTAIYASVLLPDGTMIASGHSLNEQGLFRREIARLNPDGTADPAFAAALNDRTETIYLQRDGRFIVGGFFSLANGINRRGLARFNPDGTLDESFQADTDNFVWTIAGQHDGKVLVCGGFTTVDGISRPGVARLAVNLGAPFVRLQKPSLERGRFRLTVPTLSGMNYILQSRQLNSSRWISRPPVAGDGSPKQLEDPDAATSSGRMYRVRVDEVAPSASHD
ncbi:MAG: delta-60 repeat domain-containing protein [Verrucomicrobiia bacterium]